MYYSEVTYKLQVKTIVLVRVKNALSCLSRGLFVWFGLSKKTPGIEEWRKEARSYAWREGDIVFVTEFLWAGDIIHGDYKNGKFIQEYKLFKHGKGVRRDTS